MAVKKGKAPNIQTSKNSSETRLSEQIKLMDKALDVPRQRMTMFVNRYTGRYYGSGTTKAEPLQMLYSLVSVLSPQLVIDPECLVTTDDQALVDFASVFRTNVNKCLTEIGFGETMESVIIDAMFMLGITKTGITDRFSRHWDEKGNYLADPGKVFVDQVQFHNWIGDLNAHTHREMAWQGDRYLIDYERALDLYRGQEKLIKSLRGQTIFPESGGPSEAAMGTKTLDDHYTEKIQLTDVWLPGKGVIVVVAGNPEASGGKYVGEREYKGPESGPYDYFQLSKVPANFLQIPLVSVVYDLHELMNAIARKIQRQAERQKDLIFVPKSKPELAQTIKRANDGDVLLVDDPNSIASISQGGVNNMNYQVVAWMHDYFNRISGNPDLISGTGPQANTLGQDQQNLEQSGNRLGWYRRKLMNSAGSVVRKVSWYEWTDPVRTRKLTLETETGVAVPIRWTPSLREGEWLEYNLAVNPYSKRSEDPDVQYRKTMEWAAGLVPFMPLAAEQGMLFDVQHFARVTGELRGIRQAGMMFRRGAPIQGGGGGGGGASANKPRSAFADNRVVRRLPAKPQAVESQAQEAGVET